MESCLLVKPPSGHPLDSPARRAAPSTRHALRQGRYKSLIVEEDSHLGALLHYVHLNPENPKGVMSLPLWLPIS